MKNKRLSKNTQINSDSILKRYMDIHTEKAEKAGLTSEALWGSQKSQHIRFSVLEKLFLKNSEFSVLDLGCGLGDFCKYLFDNNFKRIQYTGVDINRVFVDESQQRFPESTFIHGSIESIPIGLNFDYVIASGIYNLGDSPAESAGFFVEQFTQLFESINIGLAVNFLSAWSTKKDNISTYHNPSEMLALCYQYFGPNIVIYHNYLPNDFTVFIYKNQTL